jgi:hypothetical protein
MRTLEISEETYQKIRAQLKEEEKIDIKSLEDFIGKSFFFRTVTYHFVGRVVKILPFGILQLEDASWIPDSGRFMQAIKEGNLNEIEPLGEWFISLPTCTDFGFWKHSLKLQQK